MFYLGRAHDEVTPRFSALEQHLRVDKTDQPVPAQHIVLFASCHRLHVFFLVFTLNLRSPEHCCVFFCIRQSEIVSKLAFFSENF